MVEDGALATWIKWHLGDRIMCQLHNGRQLTTKRINLQVLLPRLDSGANGRMEEDLLRVICKHLECHGVSML